MENIKKIIKIEPHSIFCQWSDGLQRKINLRNFIFNKPENSSIGMLRDELIFNNVKLNEEIGTLYWENLIYRIEKNGIKVPDNLDLSPELLLEFCE